jgi:hypothetical protein
VVTTPIRQRVTTVMTGCPAIVVARSYRRSLQSALDAAHQAA